MTAERAQAELADRWVCFETAGQLYGLAILGVQEVLATAQIEPVPGAPETVLGVLNLRGSIVTVMDLRRRLGLPDLQGPQSIIVIRSGAQIMGLAVDGIASVHGVLPSQIQPAPLTGHGARAIQPLGLVKLRQRVLTLLDAAALIPQAD